MKRGKTNLTIVFWISIFLVGLVILPGTVIPESFQDFTRNIRNLIGTDLGWYYLLLVTGVVFFCLFLIISPIGQIKLGDPDSEPEHSNISWLAMLFSAGMGIGLVFWGAAEPLSHYAISSPVATPGSLDALRDSLKYTYFHWGIHAWSVYAIVALALAYFKFRKKEKSLLSVTLKPLIGSKTEGVVGNVIDSITTFATIIGVATTLGFGAIQINGGLNYLFGVPKNIWIQLLIISITTVLFIMSALSGIGKGVKILSNLNIILAVGLMAVSIVVGPSVKIMNVFVDTIGTYLQSFLRLSFRTAANDADQSQWIQNWTIFYWAWWISWSPFVGVFIARISKGRTIREFLTNVLLVPTLFSFLWFAAFGTMANTAQMESGGLTKLATEEVLFGTFAHYPLGIILSVIAILLVFSFFITSADSATFVLGMLSEDGSLNPNNRTKVIWGLLVSLIAVVLLATGGLDALQNILIIVALPFSVIILLMMVALYIELNHERKKMGLSIKPETYPKKGEPFRSYEED